MQSVEIEKENVEYYDSLFIKLVKNKKVIIFGAVYRLPKASIDHDTSVCEKISNIVRGNITAAGNFALPRMDWRNLSGDTASDHLFQLVSNLFLTQTILEPIRGNNLLDLVLTTDEDLLQCYRIDEPFANSDYKIIRFVVNTNVTVRDNCLMVFSCERAKFNGLKQEIASADWYTLLNVQDANVACNLFTEKLLAIKIE